MNVNKEDNETIEPKEDGEKFEDLEDYPKKSSKCYYDGMKRTWSMEKTSNFHHTWVWEKTTFEDVVQWR